MIANAKEIGTINKFVLITVECPTVRAASIPIFTLLPPNLLLANSLAASAIGINPSINIATIFGMIFITAPVAIPNCAAFAKSYFAKNPTIIPMMIPITTVSPKNPKRFAIVSESASILLNPGILSKIQFNGTAINAPDNAII